MFSEINAKKVFITILAKHFTQLFWIIKAGRVCAFIARNFSLLFCLLQNGMTFDAVFFVHKHWTRAQMVMACSASTPIDNHNISIF